MQRKIWQQAVQEAGGKVPPAKTVKDIVERVMERTKVPNPYHVGDVCQIIAKDNPDLRGKGGYWCIITQVNEYSCAVIAWDGEYILRIDHLKSLNFSDSECGQIQILYHRIAKITSHKNLEPAAISAIKQLGEIKRSYLTELEETFLSAMERYYK